MYCTSKTSVYTARTSKTRILLQPIHNNSTIKYFREMSLTTVFLFVLLASVKTNTTEIDTKLFKLFVCGCP